MDVFLRTYPTTAFHTLRPIMFGLVKARLKDMPVRLEVIAGSGFPDFHRSSKARAETLANSPIYCVLDDDQLPIRDDFFAQGEKALTENPEYGMLAGFPLEYGLHGQPYAACSGDVVEAHSIGCPYFVRKGTLSFPDGPLRQYDGILSKVVTDQGLKTGFARKAVYNHLGYGFSQVQHAD